MSTNLAPSAPALTQPEGRGKRKRNRDFKQNNLAGYLFISPWLVGFFLFGLIPMVISLALAFTNYDILAPARTQFTGLDNFYRMFFEDRRYGSSLRATTYYVVMSVPLRLIIALGIAMLLNTKRRGISFYRAAYYLPSIIGGSVAVAVMWRQMFGAQGLVNAFGALLGLDPVRWLGDPRTAIWTLIFLAMWQFGSPMLIFLAGLRQIPNEYYEAAEIDGAGAWSKFLKITLPLLTPIIFFNLVLQIIGSFRVFTPAFIITGGAPLDTTLFYTVYLYNRAFETFQMGYASAMAWVLLAIIAVLTAINFSLSRRWVFYETDVR
jgi:multiple sugar transport system permease protein